MVLPRLAADPDSVHTLQRQYGGTADTRAAHLAFEAAGSTTGKFTLELTSYVQTTKSDGTYTQIELLTSRICSAGRW